MQISHRIEQLSVGLSEALQIMKHDIYEHLNGHFVQECMDGHCQHVTINWIIMFVD